MGLVYAVKNPRVMVFSSPDSSFPFSVTYSLTVLAHYTPLSIHWSPPHLYPLLLEVLPFAEQMLTGALIMQPSVSSLLMTRLLLSIFTGPECVF